jgi:hypothetical protein
MCTAVAAFYWAAFYWYMLEDEEEHENLILRIYIFQGY